MKSHLLFLLLLSLGGLAQAATPPATGPVAPAASLAVALNPDGTLRPGVSGSFDARQFRMRTAPDGRPIFSPAGTTGAGDASWQDGFGLPNGTDGVVRAVVQAGTNVYIGGQFTTVGALPASGVVRWNGSTWSSLGTGLTRMYTTDAGLATDAGTANVLVVASNGMLYVGGLFTKAGGLPVGGVALWNGTAWSSLGTTAGGLNGVVRALVLAPGGELYVGGDFTTAGGGGGQRRSPLAACYRLERARWRHPTLQCGEYPGHDPQRRLVHGRQLYPGGWGTGQPRGSLERECLEYPRHRRMRRRGGPG